MQQKYEKLVEIASEFKEKTFKKGSSSFSYLVANESAKKMVVIVHGVTGNKLDMVTVGREYTRQGYAVYAPDLPGHGNARAIPIRNFNDLSNWLRDAIASTDRTPDILMGNSYASSICYNFARQGYLASKTHLVLACPTPDIAWASRALRTASRMLPSKLTVAAYNSSLAIKVRIAYLLMTSDPVARTWLYESERHKIPFIDSKIANTMSMLLETDNPYIASHLASSVQKRVTVVIGERDNVITRKSLPLLHQILPHASFVIIPGVGHILHFEAPKQLAEVQV